MITDVLPWVESPFFEEIIKSRNLTAEQEKIVREYNSSGYVVVPGILPLQLIDAVKEDVEKRAFDPNYPIKTQRDDTRIQDFWQVSEPAKQLACYPKVLELLKLLYDREPVPFQTLNFRVGSQQRAHSDTIHFSSLPPKFMCGVWVALEDITEENGPVFYYPGSQKLPEYDFSHIKPTANATSYNEYEEYNDFLAEIIRVNKLEKKKFIAKKGDLLIWSSNIIHGGSPVTKVGSTRWSQVTHYYFEDCIYYTPMLSNMVTKELFLRRRIENIKTGKLVEQSYNGNKLKFIRTKDMLFILNNNIKKVPKFLNFIGNIVGR